MRNRGRKMRLTEESYLDRFDNIDDLYDKVHSFRISNNTEMTEEIVNAIEDRYGEGGVKAFYTYYRMKRHDKKILDMNDASIYKGEEKGAIEFLREFGIDEIALSGNSTANNKLSWAFIKNGCKLKGMELIDDKPAFMFDILN